MNFFQRRRILKKANYLDLVPVRMQEHTEEEGKMTIIVPKFKNQRFAEWFIPRRRSKHFRIKLDENGSSVWRLIDGQRNIAEISDALSEHLKDDDSVEQVRDRVTRFVTQLYDQRYVSFTILAERV